MLIVSFLASALSVAVHAATVVAPQDPRPAPPQPPTLALLVAVDAYPATAKGDHLPPLSGPKNDVARAREVLLQRFGFTPESIHTLVGPQATHAAIVREFHQHLVQQAGPDTKAVFWFSGHGARVPDASGHDAAERPAGTAAFDDTLVAYDSRAVDADGGYDITDDELESLVRALPTKDVVLVYDCCHSGGLLRGGGEPGVRECAAGTSPLDTQRVDRFWPASVTRLDDDPNRPDPDCVLVAACGPMQQAGEIATEVGTFGTMTWFLTQTLTRVAPDTSWARVAAETAALVACQGNQPNQRVEVHGAVGRAIFGGRGLPVPDGYRVEAYRENAFWLPAGRLHGLGVGAQLELVDAESRRVGAATVTGVRPHCANAEWSGSEPMPRVALWARQRTPGQDVDPLRLVLGPGIDADVLRSATTAVIVDGPPQLGDCRLRLEQRGFVLTDASGRVLRKTKSPDMQALAVELRKEHRFVTLWNGITEVGTVPIDVRIDRPSKKDLADGDYPMALAEVMPTGPRSALVGAPPFVNDETGQPDRKSGGLVVLEVVNRADRDMYIAVVSMIATTRETCVVFGKPNHPNLLKSGEPYRKLVWVGPDQHTGPDAFTDRYVIIATTERADVSPFEDGGLTRGRADGLPEFLQDALGGTTRGPLRPQPWGLVTFDMEIVSPQRFAAVIPRPKQGAAGAAGERVGKEPDESVDAHRRELEQFVEPSDAVGRVGDRPQGQHPHAALRVAKAAAKQRGAAFRDWAGWVLSGR